MKNFEVPCGCHIRHEDENNCECGCNDDLIDISILWMDHLYLTREFILLSSFGKDTTGIVQYLMLNQERLGNNLSIFSDVMKGGHYTTLLKEHINLAATIVSRMIEGLSPDSSVELLYENGRKISELLATVGNISYDQILYHFTQHLNTLLSTATAILKGGTGLDESEEGRDEMIMMIDYLQKHLG